MCDSYECEIAVKNCRSGRGFFFFVNIDEVVFLNLVVITVSFAVAEIFEYLEIIHIAFVEYVKSVVCTGDEVHML